MAHNIDFSTGQAAFVSYLKKPWWGVGNIINKEITLDELERDYPILFPFIEKTETFVRINGVETPTGVFSTYRKDTGKILGNVGDRYHIVQNAEFFSILNFWTDYILETAGLLKDGAIAFFSANFKTEIRVGKNDEVLIYLTGWNGHEGSQPLQYLLSPIRVECNNTLDAAIANLKWQYTIKHTENWRDKQADAANIVKMIQEGSLKLEEAYNHMASLKIQTDRQILDFIANVYCSPKELKDIKEAGHPFGVISTRKLNMMREVLEYTFDGPGQQGMGNDPNYWLAYNGITGGFCNVKEYASAEDRLTNLYKSTSVQNYTQRAAALALKPEAIVSLGINNLNEN